MCGRISYRHPAEKKNCDLFLKSEFLVTSTSSWALPHDKRDVRFGQCHMIRGT